MLALLVLTLHERAWMGYGRHPVYAMHKPTGVTTEHGSPATRGEGGRKLKLNDYVEIASALAPPEGRATAMGRLDKETSGLLLLTADGKLTELVLRPGGLRKVYTAECKLRQPLRPTQAQLQHLLRGVDLADGVAQADDVEVLDEWSIDPPAARSLRYGSPKQRKRAVALSVADDAAAADEAAAMDAAAAAATRAAAAAGGIPGFNVAKIRIAVRIGRHRVVRRMLAAVGLPVYALHRDEIGPLRLDDLAIPEPGDVALLSDAEQVALRTSCEGGATPPTRTTAEM